MSTVRVRLGHLPALRQTFVSPRLHRFLCAAAIAVTAAGEAQSQTPAIAFVQSNWASLPSAATTITAAYTAAQTAGNLNVVIVTWNDTTAQVQTVSDTSGNAYQRAVGATTRSSVASQSLYYAVNNTTAGAGANTVMVTFSSAATTPELRVAEYTGIDPLQPFDVAAGSSGNSSSSSASVTTRNANDLLLGANWASNVTTGAGAAYTSRMITTPGDILEDRVVTATGSYSATAPVSPSGTWIMQVAAFRAAGSPQPDLTLTKTHSASFTQGQTGGTYTLTVSNAGAWPTTGSVTVVDTLPAGLTATGLSGSGWTCTPSTVTCTRSSVLAAGSSYAAITLTVSVAANAPASVTNTATVAGGGETNTANDVASDVTTINPAFPDLTLTKTHTGSFSQGQTGAKYTLTVRNSGSASTSGVVTVRDTLPAGLTATGLSGTNWSCTLSTLTCTRSSVLRAGSSYPVITLTVNVTASASASLTNTATVSGGGETNAANDTASDVTAITQLADLTLSKTHSGGFTRGQTGATYSLTASNIGNGPTTGTPGGTIADYFTPWNQGTINANDFDLGAAGPLLLPDQPGPHPHLMVSAGKNNTVYLVDRDAMGHYSGTTNDNQIVQSLINIFPFGTPEPGNYSAAVYFNGTVYFGPIADNIQAFPLTNGLLRTTSLTRSTDVFKYPGATMAISAAGASNGILWAIQRNGDCGVQPSCGTAAPGVLKAYDASNLGVMLYSSDQMGSRDMFDFATKFSVPLVANGKVFVGSLAQLTVYGLLP